MEQEQQEEPEIINPCIVCKKAEAIESGLCEKCYGEVNDRLDGN